MCGISVIYNKQKTGVDSQELQQMTDIIAHRGPDDFDYYKDDIIGLGHRRLSIIDLSTASRQPFSVGEYVMVFNGEIFNYIELKAQLIKENVSFTTDSDTEVLLRAYMHWGNACLHRFNGMWAFAIYNTKDQSVFFSRDRYGIKPLYLYEDEKGFYFASEIKQFTQLSSWKNIINANRLIDFLVEGRLNHTDETLFEGVNAVPAGYSGTISDGQFSMSAYYDLSSQIEEKDTTLDAFKAEWDRSVDMRLRSDVPLGVSLSGGLDSTCIAYSATAKKGKIKSYSIVYDEPEISEKRYVDDATKQFRTEKNVFSPDYETMMESLKDVVWHQDQPIASTSVIAQYLLYNEHKKHGTVVSLSGQGADEILAGYYPFFLPYIKSLIKSGSVIELAKTIKIMGRQLVQTKMKKSKPNYFKVSAEAGVNPDQSTITKKSLYYVAKTLPLLLHYEDRNSMAHSIESRQPFMDHELVELCLSLKPQYKIKNGVSKYILRQSMKDHIPSSIYQRVDKLGYSTPQQRWFFEHKEEIIIQIKGSVIASYLKPDFFSDYLSANVGDIDDGLIIRLLSAISWVDAFGLELKSV